MLFYEDDKEIPSEEESEEEITEGEIIEPIEPVE